MRFDISVQTTYAPIGKATRRILSLGPESSPQVHDGTMRPNWTTESSDSEHQGQKVLDPASAAARWSLILTRGLERRERYGIRATADCEGLLACASRRLDSIPSSTLQCLRSMRSGITSYGIHKTLSATPAIQTGLTTRLWTFEDAVEMIDELEASQKTAG